MDYWPIYRLEVMMSGFHSRKYSVEMMRRQELRSSIKPSQEQHQAKCPRCDSANTKFCYYNNYSLNQPRHFCKACRRYWTRGGSLRNVPVGGRCRKTKPSKNYSTVSVLSENFGMYRCDSLLQRGFRLPHEMSTELVFHDMQSSFLTVDPDPPPYAIRSNYEDVNFPDKNNELNYSGSNIDLDMSLSSFNGHRVCSNEAVFSVSDQLMGNYLDGNICAFSTDFPTIFNQDRLAMDFELFKTPEVPFELSQACTLSLENVSFGEASQEQTDWAYPVQ